MSAEGILSYLVFFFTMAGIYATLCLGLNVQWGYTGLFNIGIAGFFAIGAYTSAILTTPSSPLHLGGFGLPFAVGFLAAGVVSGLLALLIGIPTLRLREDYLAIATIGIAETIRYVLLNEQWLAGGIRGLAGIPFPLRSVLGPRLANYFYLALVLGILALLYIALERGLRSPWGRVLKAIREDEHVASASGKDVFRFRLEALVLGSTVMGFAGSLYAHFVGFISPAAFHPMLTTFIVWVMLIVGGSGNNKGAIAGGYIVWAIWTLTEFVTDFLPSAVATRSASLRVVLIGLLLIVMLLYRPRGFFGEERHVSRALARRAQSGKAEL